MFALTALNARSVERRWTVLATATMTLDLIRRRRIEVSSTAHMLYVLAAHGLDMHNV